MERPLVRLEYGAGPGAILNGSRLWQADLLGANLTNARYAAADLAGALHVPVHSGGPPQDRGGTA